MIQTGAISALQALESLTEAQEARAARPTQARTDAANSADATDRGPAVINEVQDIRKKFTDIEIRTVAVELGSWNIDSVLATIAAGRDRGEDMILISARFKDGGGMATVMSRSQLDAAINSDDPASMGSYTGSDGKTRYVRDMVREVANLDEALSKGPDAPVAEGVVKELRAYIRRPELDEAENLKLDDKKDEGALRFKKDGDSVSITVFEAKPKPSPASASYGQPGAPA